jgi:hypothetical protein
LRPAWAKKFVRFHLNAEKLGMVAPACHPSYSRKYIQERLWSRPTWTKSETLSSKNNQSKKGWMHQLSKFEVLSSNPRTTKKKGRMVFFFKKKSH